MNSKPHIMIVDDETDRRLLTLQILKHALDVTISTVSSVKELLYALVQNFENGQAIDLILMDIQMPEVNGIDGCRQIKEIPVCRDIPVLMLTAMADPKTLEKAFEAGATDYILKMADPIEFIARIKAALKGKSERDLRLAREQELMQLTQQLISKQDKPQTTSFRDELTGIYNRAAFDKMFKESWAKAYIQKVSLGLAFVSIDYFSEFNLARGTEAGDSLLKTFTTFLPATQDRVFSARYQGAVFAWLTLDARRSQQLEQAEALVYRVRDARIENPKSMVDLYVTASVGCALLDAAMHPRQEDLLKMAQNALLSARELGYNRAVQHTHLQDEGPFVSL